MEFFNHIHCKYTGIRGIVGIYNDCLKHQYMIQKKLKSQFFNYPRHPQMNTQIESFNRTIQAKSITISKSNKQPWIFRNVRILCSYFSILIKNDIIFIMDFEWIKSLNSELIKNAYEFAKEAHSGSKRLSGEDYINHPLRVAKTVYEWGLDEKSIAAAFLHDVVEDTGYMLKDIEKKFGEEIAFLVNGLTKLKDIKIKENQDAENIRKLVLSFSRDIRVLIIKIADRLDNMRTLNFLPPESQKPIALETLEIYASLANRLGMQKISGELEDLAFPYVYPEQYQWLINELKDDFEERQKYALSLVPILEKELKNNNLIPIKIDARAKRYYSLYKKLLRYDMDLNKIYDLVALRVIVNTVEECYLALGIIHKMWQPFPGRIKDYISRPKPNGYKSLHTTVFTDEGKIIEIQIRTEQMHEEDELGIAAHWAYKQLKPNDSKKNWSGFKNKSELLWIQQLRNWIKNFSSSNDKEFLEIIKTDFLKDRIFVLTPENDIIDLPADSTPIDFAYKIHSQIGDNCVAAKVNGKIVPLDFILHSGDVVEIITQKGKKPSEDWLRLVKTINAKKQIKKSLKRKFPDFLKKKDNASFIEIKITNIDRPGYLKDVTEVFAANKVNIVYLKSETSKRASFSTVIIKIKNIDVKKLELLLVKIKKIDSTKEVNFKTVY